MFILAIHFYKMGQDLSREFFHVYWVLSNMLRVKKTCSCNKESMQNTTSWIGVLTFPPESGRLTRVMVKGKTLRIFTHLLTALLTEHLLISGIILSAYRFLLLLSQRKHCESVPYRIFWHLLMINQWQSPPPPSRPNGKHPLSHLLPFSFRSPFLCPLLWNLIWAQ